MLLAFLHFEMKYLKETTGCKKLKFGEDIFFSFILAACRDVHSVIQNPLELVPKLNRFQIMESE